MPRGTASVSDASREFVSGNPGRDVQRVGTARFLGEDVAKVHDPVWGVIGTLGDSQCYLGVRSKVDAVHDALAQRIHDDDLPVRLIAPAFTLGRLRRPAQRHRPDAVLADESRAGQRQHGGAPQGQRHGGGRHGRRVRQAARRHPGRPARAQRPGADALRRLDPPRDRPRDRRAHRPRDRVPVRRRSRPRGARPPRAARVSRPGQLWRHVHLQHHADVHRRAGHGTAAHGRSGLRRRAPHEDVPRRARRAARPRSPRRGSAPATSSPPRRCATPSSW